MKSSLPRQEQAHTRNDASDNYRDTHECLQQIDEYETLEGHNGMKANYNLWTSDMHEYFAGQATQDGIVDTY
ncbi:hypothetical protein PRUPE_7G107500 [Prunus persica]|uniref:Uncharacterized protein n=1 Tax=Prunus persica TaxID=3760 RepID=A0A251N9V0_PRUPE|nr:hypothetical protein PRUPE_7G107500 [Prunus persica]